MSDFKAKGHQIRSDGAPLQTPLGELAALPHTSDPIPAFGPRSNLPPQICIPKSAYAYIENDCKCRQQIFNFHAVAFGLELVATQSWLTHFLVVVVVVVVVAAAAAANHDEPTAPPGYAYGGYCCCCC